MMERCKKFEEYLKYPDVGAFYELYAEGSILTGAKVIGYFIDENSEKHEFVRWDSSHKQFHKHYLYERKQRKEDIPRPLKKAFVEARCELRENWQQYQKDFKKYHINQIKRESQK